MPFHHNPGLTPNLFMDVNELLDSSAVGWKGTYLPFTKDDPTDQHINNGLKDYYIIRATTANFGGESSGTQPTVCVTPCYYWVGLRSQDATLAKAVDLKVDGGTANTYDSGSLRLFPNLTKYNIWMKGPVALTQP